MDSNNLLLIMAISSLVWLPATSAAADRGVYLGAEGGTSHASDMNAATIDSAFSVQGLRTLTTSVDDSDTAWKLFAGYRFNRYLAVEGAYAYLGKFDFKGVTVTDPGTVEGRIKATAWSLSAMGILPLGERFSAFAKAGGAYWQTDLETTRTAGGGNRALNRGENGTDWVFGAGLGLSITQHVGARLEWERYNHVGDSSTGKSSYDLLLVGVYVAF